MNDLIQTAKAESDPKDFAAPGAGDGLKTDGSVTRFEAVWVLALFAFALAAAVALTHRPLSQMEAGDEAIWDYVSQCIVRGQVPYREVVEIKAPLSAYLSATAMLLGKPAGLRDVIAVRLLNILMLGALSSVTFLVGVTYLRSRLAAVIAFLILLAPSHFAEWMVTGTEPKLPMILFGMLSLLLVAKRKAFWAGFFSMLACLCWQPGLMFTAVALLMFSRYLTCWRDRAALKATLGAAVPLAVLVVYFYLNGALGDLWNWTVVYNFSVYAPETIKSVSETLAVLWKVLIRVFGYDLALVVVGAVGLIAFGIERIRVRLKAAIRVERPDVFRDAILIPPVIYLVFCLINFQSGPDLIPLFPFIGLFGAYALVKLSAVRLGGVILRPLPGLASGLIVALILFRAATHRVDPGLTLKNQDTELTAISNALGPQDSIYVHGALEILVLLDRPNVNPYIFLDRGKDDWIARGKPGGFGAVIDEMESLAPKLVALSRLGKVAHRAELEHWVNQHYDRVEAGSYRDVYFRQQP